MIRTNRHVLPRSFNGVYFRGAKLRFRVLLALSCLLTAITLSADSPTGAAPFSTSHPDPAVLSIPQFKARLQHFDQLIAACQQNMTAANCRSDQVGADDRLDLPSGPRQVRYAWLRELLARAAEKQPTSKNAGPTLLAKSGSQPAEFIPPTIAQQLELARERLASDVQSVNAISDHQPGDPAVANSPQRQTLTRILAAREYQSTAAGPSLMDRLLEVIGNVLSRVIALLQHAGFQSRWVGITAEVTFVVIVCVVLVWLLIRLERQGRLATSMDPGSGGDAVSARDWQLWLEDARAAAARGFWRDAIHFTYWASISRLESSGLWPADRARTPREYLALLSPESSAHSDLAILTRSFERTWYAGRAAAEAEFRQAEQIAARIGVKSRNTAGPR